MIEAMDHEIGRLLASLAPEVLARTTVVFVGDNGTPNCVPVAPFAPDRAKGYLFEGGVNVPLIVKSPLLDPTDGRGFGQPRPVFTGSEPGDAARAAL